MRFLPGPAFPCLLLAASSIVSGEYSAPAGSHWALARPGAPSILPGGRLVAPLGHQYIVGPGCFGMALSPDGRMLVTANTAPERPSLSVLAREKNGSWRVTNVAPEESDEWRGVFMGVAFANRGAVYVSEGESGMVRLIDLASGSARRTYSLNQDGAKNSHTGALAFDGKRGLLHVLDPGNSRLVSIDVRRNRIVASLRLEHSPFDLALSADGGTAYVTLPDAGSVAVVSFENAATPSFRAAIPTGGNPSGVLATDSQVFVSNARDDCVTMIDARTNAVTGEVPLRIPGLERYRGVLPFGMAYDAGTGWLLVAEAGINAVGVIDVRRRQVAGHLPAAWFPTRVLISDGSVYVSNAMGHGSGPYARRGAPERFMDLLHRGSVSIFPMPDPAAVPKATAIVLEANGFRPRAAEPPALPAEVRHVVLIVKRNRGFDEILGDIEKASNGPVAALPRLARFGSKGYADGLRVRLSLEDVNVTPNHHGIAERWSFSDNFYADPAVEDLPGAGWKESWLESGARHLERRGITVRNFDEGGEISDQARATRFIQEVEANYRGGGAAFPRFVRVSLPNDRMSKPRPGYPYEASWVSDNDYALGRIVDYLSHSPWWRQMTVFVAEEEVHGGYDHIDVHRAPLLVAGPYVKKNYVSHVNASFPALLKTTFRLLGAPPMKLQDAAASTLTDCFTNEPDFTPYDARQVDSRLLIVPPESRP